MKSLPILLMALLLACSAGAQAQTRLLDDRVTLSGFGTLGLIHSDQDRADFVRDTGQPKGAEKGWSARTDTRLGLQASVRLTDELDTVVQGMSQYHSSGDFSPELMLAFVRYAPDPGFQLRVGRLGWDVDLISESRYVGFAYPWIRPPVDHFGVLQLTYIDGADVTFTRPVGDDLVWARLVAGRSDSRFFMSDALEADFDAHNVLGGHLNYETGPWRFRAGYTRVRSEVSFSGGDADLIDQMFNIDANRYLNYLTGFDELQVYSLGAAYSSGPLQLQAIWNRDILADGDTWLDTGFVSAAWRMDRWTPYAMASGTRTHDSREDPIGSNIEQNTWSLGLRYDVTTHLALKAQFDRIHTRSPGLLWRGIDDGWKDDQSNLVSLGLDFIF
ncbi:porin [Kushneria indalinina]|uniref:Porin-like protein n=1 Tax=Kushneria indalinina DSM 14324 TaxID=1122140 RepID=A0A3D9DU39_9GAMM|nr:porin [Kushneria indalinina]REC94252.1 porin-like protein [Kushneria indalinina DSM 14324]